MIALSTNDRWLRKKHPRICDAVQIPAKSNADNDNWRSTTVLPYLKALYDPCPTECGEEGEDVISCTGGQDRDGHLHAGHVDEFSALGIHSNENNNNNETTRAVRSRSSRSACRPSKTSAFLSCLGMRKDKCKQS